MRRTFKDKFWDVVIWVSLVIILIWVLLKSFGIIHSPLWVEMIPYYSGLSFLLGIVYKAGKIVETINYMGYDIKVLKNKFDSFENRFSKIEHEHDLCIQGKLKLHK
jgi:hypothetical protein